jgi:hypothetical protein
MLRPLLSSLIIVFLTSSALPAQQWAQKLFATTEHDFGTVARGAKAEYAFVLTNNLRSDVHIAAVRTSCGCTTPSVENEKRTLKSYESGAILAHLNSDTHLGYHAATLTVTFDRPYFAEVQLQVHALIATSVLMEPSSAEFGAVEQGKASEVRVRLYHGDFPNWEIQSVRVSDPNLRGEIVPVARQGNQTWYDLRVHLARTAPPGYISDRAVLTTNDRSMGPIFVQVEGQVQPKLVVSPADLFLGVLHVGEKVTKPLVVRADKPFHIRAVTGDKASFEIPKLPDAAKSVQVVPITFVAGRETGKVVKTIHIETDLGDAQATSYAVVDGNSQK